MHNLSPWDRLTPQQRVSAVNVDIMNHAMFSTLSGAVMMGNLFVGNDVSTAGTNGRDIYYNQDFLLAQTRKQLRYIQAHEALHITLKHTLDYKDLATKYPRECNIAMDYVVNAFIEQTDPRFEFVERPLDPEPLVDPKYFGRSFVDVLQDLLRNPPPQEQQSAGGGQGSEPLDEHMPAPADIQEDELRQEVSDALNSGDMMQKRLAGEGGGGNPLKGLGVDRSTDWRSALRDWFNGVSKGDTYSRMCPPNRRFLPLDILMPSHFDVTAGEVAILGDTSGSMEGVYPVMFGEIAAICKQANPDMVRLIWWDSEVRSEQVFKRGQYDQIAKQLKPVGGGGTTPQAVEKYLRQKQYPLTGAIWLTDGYLTPPNSVCKNELWAVINNDFFKPKHGKTMRIHV